MSPQRQHRPTLPQSHLPLLGHQRQAVGHDELREGYARLMETLVRVSTKILLSVPAPANSILATYRLLVLLYLYAASLNDLKRRSASYEPAMGRLDWKPDPRESALCFCKFVCRLWIHENRICVQIVPWSFVHRLQRLAFCSLKGGSSCLTHNAPYLIPPGLLPPFSQLHQMGIPGLWEACLLPLPANYRKLTRHFYLQVLRPALQMQALERWAYDEGFIRNPHGHNCVVLGIDAR